MFNIRISFLFISFLLLCSCESKQEELADELKSKKEAPENDLQRQNYFLVPEIPDSIHFVDQWIDLTDTDLRERFDRELIVNNFWHSNTILYLKRANRWFPLMSSILKEENVPEDMLYLAVIESGLTQATSPSGARGFWQFMEPTARGFGLEINNEIDERLHIKKSTLAACQYLKEAHEKFDSWILAAASYNRGKGGIQSNLDGQGVESYFDLSLNSETARYVFRILAVKAIMNDPLSFGFKIEPHQLYPPYETISVTVEKTIPDLYQWSKEQGFNIKILRKLNPWIKGSKLTVQPNKEFKVDLPKNNEQLSTFEG
ncbi:MAG: lytic transglycosylase domain-containing protein [Brumimicrobium sp.]